MPMQAIQEYLDQLPARMAELKLIMSEAGSMPWLKPEDQQTQLRRWLDVAGVEEHLETATPETLMAIGIGVRHE